MPIYSFEQLLNGAMDRVSPGSTILLSSFHKGPPGGVAVAKNIIKESLFHRSGKMIITCGYSKCGDKHVCTK